MKKFALIFALFVFASGAAFAEREPTISQDELNRVVRLRGACIQNFGEYWCCHSNYQATEFTGGIHEYGRLRVVFIENGQSRTWGDGKTRVCNADINRWSDVNPDEPEIMEVTVCEPGEFRDRNNQCRNCQEFISNDSRIKTAGPGRFCSVDGEVFDRELVYVEFDQGVPLTFLPGTSNCDIAEIIEFNREAEFISLTECPAPAAGASASPIRARQVPRRPAAAAPKQEEAVIEVALIDINASFPELTRSSDWTGTEGGFNWARAGIDAGAAVILGTVGGFITHSLVKNRQVEKGFENVMCTVGGASVAGWGDVFMVGPR
ncbi:MAG: hypothetical protein FWD33_02730 [Alphaproteobacteria bacterium]|nr:hypothetical protein [Alphaproteobacteria bacterium]